MKKVTLIILFSFSLAVAFAQRATDSFKLYFDLNIDRMNAATEKKIDLLIYNDKIIAGSSVTIVGYADFLGTEKYNKDLSMRRAKNVKDYLVKNGISGNDIKMCVGRGEVERAGLTDKEGYPTDRRVDIVVNNRSKNGSKPRRDSGKTIATLDGIKHLKPGAVILLKNVYFPADRHFIKPESAETLEKLYNVMKDNPNLKISIEGHVCCISKEAPDALDIDTYEPILSVNRAKAIYNYLVDRGISPARLHYAGFGRTRPVVEYERNEADAEKNRRVEIRVIENNQ